METQLVDGAAIACLALHLSQANQVPLIAWHEISSDSAVAAIDSFSCRAADSYETWGADPWQLTIDETIRCTSRLGKAWLLATLWRLQWQSGALSVPRAARTAFHTARECHLYAVFCLSKNLPVIDG